VAILRFVAAFAVLVAGCYTVPSDRCALKCTTECPTGATCGADGFCHATGDDASCNAPADAAGGCPGNFAPDGLAGWMGNGGAPIAVAGRTTSGIQICSDGGFTNLSTTILDSTSIEADASFTMQAWVRTPNDPDAGIIAIAKFQEFDGGPNAIGTSSSPDTLLDGSWTPIAPKPYTTIGAKHLSAVVVLNSPFVGACLEISDVCVQRTN